MYSVFEPIYTETMQAPTSAYRYSRFHPYSSGAININRHAYGQYVASGCYPEIGSNVCVPRKESNISPFGKYGCIPGIYLSTQHENQYEKQQTNSQWAFTPKCIQNLCVLKKDIGTNHKMSSSAGGKDRVHPFYSRLRSEPAEGMTRTRDKYRVVYTEKQRRGLETEFNSNKFITHELRARISEELGLSARQIKIWFQNRRAKERRESRKGKYTEQTECNSAKEDCRTHKHSYSSLNDTDNCLTSCRYTGSENISEERQYNSGQCLFLSQTGSPDICENGTTSSRSCIFESRDNQYVTPSVSPSEWGMPTGNTFIPIVDVSPLTGIISIDEELCIRA